MSQHAESLMEIIRQTFTQRTVFFLVTLALLWLAFTAVWFGAGVTDGVWLLPVSLGLLFAAIYFLWLDYLHPLFHVRKWLLAMHAGILSSRVTRFPSSQFENISEDLNSLARMLEMQSHHTEQQLTKYTHHIMEKNRSLETLYHIATILGTTHDVDEIFGIVMETLEKTFNMRGAVIRRRLDGGRMQQVASRGTIPISDNVAILDEDSLLLQDAETEHRVIVPIEHHSIKLGVCSFYLDNETFNQRSDLAELFTSIGRHLGMAIEHVRLNDESKLLSVVEERTHIAHELHDSLAQTISSLRFQTRVLDQALHEGKKSSIGQQLTQLESSIKEANHEVRGLISHFRDSSKKHRGMLPTTVEEFVDQFREDTPGTKVILQKLWPECSLPEEYEAEVIGIIQEALTNASKHGQADFMRVLMRGNENGQFSVIIEDNGIGMSEKTLTGRKEGHYGLRIMQDRAARIHGTLSINSEPGEGVRVVLRFSYPVTEKGVEIE